MNTVHRTFAFEGSTRSYEWAAADGTSAVPLVVPLHGSGQDGKVFAGLWGTAGAGRAHFVFPTATVVTEATGVVQTRWLTLGSGIVGGDELLDERFLLALIHDLRSRLPISEVYVTGFSAGATLTQQLAIRHGEGLAGTGACSKSLRPTWQTLTVGSPKPHIELIGDADEKGEWTGTGGALSGEENRGYWAMQMGHLLGDYTDQNIVRSGVTKGLRRDYNTPGATPYRWIRVYGGGHRWFRTATNDPISASQEVLRFWGI